MFLFAWHPPVGPGTPFGDGVLAVDVLRMIALGFALLALLQLPLVLYYAENNIVRLRMLSFGLLIGLTSSIEVEHLGDFANWRLVLVTVAMIWSAWGMFAYIKYEGGIRKHRVPGREVDA